MLAARSGRGKSTAAVHFETALLPAGWRSNVRLEIDEGRIVGVVCDTAAEPSDQRGWAGLPALGNLHSHAFQRAMAGLTERRGATADSFWTWREVMYRFVERLSPDDLQAIAAMAYVEMAEAGFGRVGEFHYLHHDIDGQPYADMAEMASRLAAAADEAGLGLTLLPVFYAHSTFRGEPPSPAQRRFINDAERYARLVDSTRVAVSRLPGGHVGIAPHSLRAVTPTELREILPLAAGGPVHIHIAEQVKEVEDCLAWSGARPVEWLLDNAPVDASWCLVHATHMTGAETMRLAASGAVAGLCPITEANLGDGVFPAAGFVAAGGAWGVGSDSNVRISATEELRLLEYGQRLFNRSRNIMASPNGGSTGRFLFDAARAGGGQALAYASGLEVGADADIVGLSARHAGFAGRGGDEILDTLIFADNMRPIEAVWLRGRKVVSEGVHHQRERVERRYRRVLECLLGA